MIKLKSFTFPIALNGIGRTSEEAWINAVETFVLLPRTFEQVIDEGFVESDEEEEV